MTASCRQDGCPATATGLRQGRQLYPEHHAGGESGWIGWHESVLQHHGQDARDSARLFLVPGMDHCGGGPGLNSFDALAALEQWVENGTTPDSILGRQTSTGLRMA